MNIKKFIEFILITALYAPIFSINYEIRSCEFRFIKGKKL